jgi:hypothetical protein
VNLTIFAVPLGGRETKLVLQVRGDELRFFPSTRSGSPASEISWLTMEREPRRARARLVSDASACTYGIGTPATVTFPCENSQLPWTLLAVPANTKWLAPVQDGLPVDGLIATLKKWHWK